MPLGAHFSGPLSDKALAELQQQQLEEDAIHFLQNHPEFEPHLTRWLGADAVAGAIAFRDKMKELAGSKPKMRIDQGQTLPDEVDMDNYREEMQAYEQKVAASVKEAISLAKQEAARVRAEQGLGMVLTPVELEVPPDYLTSKVDAFGSHAEHLATITLGMAWKHLITQLPRPIIWLREGGPNRISSFIMGRWKEHRANIAKIKENYRTSVPDGATSLSLSDLYELVALLGNAVFYRLRFSIEKLRNRKVEPPAQPMPRNIDPRDWSAFVLNRILLSVAKVKAYLDNPVIAEEKQKLHSIVDPEIESIREEIIDALKKMEVQTPPPWDPKEIERVRQHGMQEKMTTKEAALILGLSYVTGAHFLA